MATSEIAIQGSIGWAARPVSTTLKRLAIAAGAALVLATGATVMTAATAVPPAAPVLDMTNVKAEPAIAQAAMANPGATLNVFVTENSPASTAAEDLVASLGGTVTVQLGDMFGFTASVPASELDRLASSDSVLAISSPR